MKLYAPGEMLQWEGEPCTKIAMIAAGFMEVSAKNYKGWEQTAGIYKSGEAIGFESLAGRNIAYRSLEALIDDVLVFEVDGKQMQAYMKKYPMVGFAMLEVMQERLHRVERLWINIE